VAQSALSLSRLGFAAFRVSWRLVDDGAAAPPSPAKSAAAMAAEKVRAVAADAEARRWRRRCSRNLGSRMVASASQGSFVGSSSPEFQICDEEWRWRCGAAKLWQVCGGGVTLLQVKVAARFVVSARFCDGREWRKMVARRSCYA